MKPDTAVFKVLCATGIPGTKTAWPLGGDPPLPWFTYKRSRGGEFLADNTNYARIWRYQVDLYQAEPDDDVRDAFEDALSELGPFRSTESWVASEGCWLTSYTLTYHEFK